MALSLIGSVNMKCSMLMASVNKTCSMKFPKIELIVLCCNNTPVDSLQNVGPNEKLDHSIVSPLQAKRETHTKTSSEHSWKCGTKWKTRSFHSLSLTSRERERERTTNIHWTFLQMWDQMKDHSIVSPLQAKRERQQTSSEHSSKCGTKWKTMYHILSLTRDTEQARERQQTLDEYFLKIWDQMKTTWFYSLSLNTQTNKHT
jgi:hypothetical protein